MNNFVEYIESVDFQYIEKRLIKKHRWSPADAKEGIRKYKNFLTLRALHPELKIVPTYGIDQIWHEHILHTEKYVEDCNRMFGEYFHHHPSEEDEKEDSSQHFIETARLYERQFQEPYGKFDIAIWF